MQHTGIKKCQLAHQVLLPGLTQESQLLLHINSAPSCDLQGWIQRIRPTLWYLIEERGTVRRTQATLMLGPRLPNG